MSEVEIPSGAIREVGQITTGAGAIIGAVVEMDEAACKAAAKLFGEPVVLVSAAELARQREVIAGLVEALTELSGEQQVIGNRVADVVFRMQRIARAALSRAQAGDGEGGEANG